MSESVVARYFDPKLGRFLTQDSFLGNHDNPPSLHRYLYANANPARFVDPTGFTAEGAEFQGVLRETKDYFIDQAQGEGVVGILKGVGFGLLAAGVGIVESGVGLIDEGATVAYSVPGVDLMGDPTGVESREEIKKQVADVKETYYTIKEEGFGNALGRVAKGATATVISAAKGDPRAIAQVTSAITEIAAPGTVLKGSGALRAIRKGAGELAEGAGRAVRRGLGEATDRLPLRWSPDPGSNLGNLRRKAARPQGGPTGRPSLRSGVSPLREYDIDYLKAFNTSRRSRDAFEGHELLQHAWLSSRGLATRRGAGFPSAHNPALAVRKSFHTELNREQARLIRAQGRSFRAMTAEQNIALNMQVLRNKGVSEHVVQALAREAEQHLDELKRLYPEKF